MSFRNIFKKLFGIQITTYQNSSAPKGQPEDLHIALSNDVNLQNQHKRGDVPVLILESREYYRGKSLRQLNDLYYEALVSLKEADQKENIDTLLTHCLIGIGLLEPVIKFNKKEYGSFDIKSIPAIDKGLLFFAVKGSTEQLNKIKDVVYFFKELAPFKNKVENAFRMQELASIIYKYTKSSPNCLLSELKENIDEYYAKLVSVTIKYMVQVGRLQSRKQGSKVYLVAV